MKCKLTIRENILDAAMQRIMHYGYSKTTMSEIASDCGMSAGNIYRFYAGKLDIAEAIARRFNDDIHKDQSKIVKSKRPAGERLRAFVEFGMRVTYDRLATDAKILEVAEILAHERRDFVEEELAQERACIAKILKDGVKSGEFGAIQNVDRTAEAVQATVMKFRYPQLFSRLSLEQLLRELAGVLALVLAGLGQGVNAPARA